MARCSLRQLRRWLKALILVSLPLPVAKYFQTARVDDKMERAFVTPVQVRDLHTTMTS